MLIISSLSMYLQSEYAVCIPDKISICSSRARHELIIMKMANNTVIYEVVFNPGHIYHSTEGPQG